MRFPHNDALVVTIYIRCCKVSKILVDGGSSVNNSLWPHSGSNGGYSWAGPEIDHPQTPSLLYGFNGNEARSAGTVEFSICADPFNIITEFCILDVQSPYNAILGRPWIHIMRAVSSTHHQLLKYPTPSGMDNKRGDQVMARTVAAVAWKGSGWAQKASRAGPNEDCVQEAEENCWSIAIKVQWKPGPRLTYRVGKPR